MSILVSLETENTATICNFETVSSFVTSQYLMRGQMWRYYLSLVSWSWNCNKKKEKVVKTYTNKTGKTKTDQSWVKRRNFFYLEMHYLSQ